MKYVIMENEHVIWGIRDWNKRSIESCLIDDCEIAFDAPSDEPNAMVFVNDNIQIYPVIVDNPVFNSKIESINGPYWVVSNGFAYATYTVHDKPIEWVKSDLKEKLAEYRYTKEISGTKVTIDNIELEVVTKRIERDIFAQALLLGSDGATWKFPNNIWIILSNTDLRNIVESVMAHVQSCFTWEESKSSEIDSLTTLQELDAYDITA